MNSIQPIEELIKEYLLFRGFSLTFRSFETDCRNDRDKGFHAEKIIEELYSFIANSDINGLLDYWEYLNIRYFSRLDARYFGSVKKFKLSLLRYYLVYATQQKRKEKVLEFFDTFEADLNGNSEWSKWFGLPFSKNPAADPYFEPFFTKQWLETFTASLHNFLNTIFQNMPWPSLLCFNIDRLHKRALESEIQSLHNVIVDLKTKIEHYDAEIANLRQAAAQPQELLNHINTQRYTKSLLDQKNKDTHNVPQFSIVSNTYHSSRSLTPPQLSYSGTKSPETCSDGRSMTPISEYDMVDTQKLLSEDINPFTNTNQETYLEQM
ncbi:WD40 repeat-like protein [Gigaspora margarita]|uniref:WD40 repeat-like protein n=2 Tax=Gigaspora margarita TaxID=4874 RepID=A0A8H4B3A2_GIGMA|nr:WD40 repeat-like protein [Gigaspora margarita]